MIIDRINYQMRVEHSHLIPSIEDINALFTIRKEYFRFTGLTPT
jgi:hypothetical protein